jgi:hypothetical protein
LRFLCAVAASPAVEAFSLVDVGCSGGLETVWRFFGDKFRAIGFDISIDACRVLAECETNPNCGG